MQGWKPAVAGVALLALIGTGCTTIVRSSVASNGAAASEESSPLGRRAISDTGRYVVFASHAANLVANDTNNRADGFRHDNQTGATIRVSVAGNGAQNPQDSGLPTISGDGDHVAFVTPRSLEPADTNNQDDVYVRNISAGTTERVSIRPEGGPILPPGPARGFVELSLSRDGRFVAMLTTFGEVFIRDRATHTSVYANESARATHAMISNDGTQLVWSVRCEDECTGLAIVQPASGGTGEPIDLNCGFTPFDVSADAGFVIGSRYAVGPTFDCPEPSGLVRWDRSSHSYLKVHITGVSTPSVSISDNGRFVAGIDEESGALDVLDLTTGYQGLGDLDASGHHDVFGPTGAALSGNGRYVAFTTPSKLVPDDTDTRSDVFTRYAFPPTVTSATPASVLRGRTNVNVKIKGSEMLSGVTASVTGTGVTINSLTYQSAKALLLDVSVDANAPLGPRDILVSNTGGFGHSDALCTGCLEVR